MIWIALNASFIDTKYQTNYELFHLNEMVWFVVEIKCFQNQREVSHAIHDSHELL